MIIACERCQTRFNVPDDKLVGGPVRMRCSKCDHTFVAAPSAPMPVPLLQSPPAAGWSAVSPVAPVTAPPRPVLATGSLPFAAVQPPGAAATFAPAPTTLPPALLAGRATSDPDPFAALAPPSTTSAPKPDPFAALAPSAPQAVPLPFAPPAPAPTKPVDPFAAFTASSPPAPDPFAALAPGRPSAASTDPFAAFAGPARAADPFATTTNSAPKPFAAFPAAAATGALNPFASMPPSGEADLFAGPSTSSLKPAEPWAAPAPAVPTDPFAAFTRPAPPVRSGVDEKPMFDPFGEAEESAPSAGPAPFATDDRPSSSDPFADLNDHDPFGPGVDAARSALFGITPPTASPGPPPLPPEAKPLTSGLELSSPPPAPTPSQVPVAAPAPRVSTRIIEAIAGVLQVVLIVGVTVLAVVVGRGGSVAGLLLLDPTQALALPTPDAETGLHIDDVRVSRRVSAAGMPLLLISGVVHHRGEQPFPAVTVEADIDGVVARGHAWTAVTPSAIEAARTAEDVAVLQSLRSQSPTVSPGERAPFVIVVAAPEGFARPRLSARPAG